VYLDEIFNKIKDSNKDFEYIELKSSNVHPAMKLEM
jgi:hypothetical protein